MSNAARKSATVIQLRRSGTVTPPPSPYPPLAVHAYVQAILQAANSLMREDLEILSFRADVEAKAPVILVKDCHRVRRLAERGVANYPAQGEDSQGRYQIGQFERAGVLVHWVERVTP